MGLSCYHLWISGQVQGVWFRQSTLQQAQALGDLWGWVRNLPDGRVEVLVAGELEKVKTLVDWCHRGPSTARVERVEIQAETVSQGLAPFHIQR